MATLADGDRARINAGLMRYFSALREQVTGLTKADLRAAVDSTDDWIDANQASFNNALPTAARNNLTQVQVLLS